MSWMPSVSSRGRTRTYDPRVMSPMSCQLLYPASNAYDPRVMSPMSCQLLYPASNAFANIYLNKNNVNSFHHAVSSFPQSECRIQYKWTHVMIHDRSNSSLQSIRRKCRNWNHPAPAKACIKVQLSLHSKFERSQLNSIHIADDIPQIPEACYISERLNRISQIKLFSIHSRGDCRLIIGV